MAFVNLNIRHRSALLRKLYAVTLTYYLIVNNFKLLYV